jgi:hypothetical protein
MIQSLVRACGSLTKALDIFYVITGNKPVSRILYEDNLEILQILKQHNLEWVFSDYKILKHVDTTRNYSDKGLMIKNDDPRSGIRILYISRDKTLAGKAKDFELKQDHVALGNLLGYPDCCCRFFAQTSRENSLGTNDMTLHTFRKSKNQKFFWQNNNCIRGFDIALISHFPCSFSCQKSKKLADENLKLIERYDPDIVNYFSHALKGPIIYSEGIGVYSFKSFRFANGILEYQPEQIIASSNNTFFQLLKSRNRLRVLGENELLIGEKRVSDDYTFFGMFS